jgi:hypothetical protein
MAWEKEAEALERNAEVMTALQKEFIRALLRVAEEHDADPVQLAMNASNMMHGLFAPLHQMQAERMQRQHLEMMREQQKRGEQAPPSPPERA